MVFLAAPTLAGPATSVPSPAIATPTPAEARIGSINPMRRVRATDPPAGSATIDLAAARGETESFQLQITAVGGRLDRVRVEVSDLAGPKAGRPFVIPRAAVTLYREHDVQVESNKTFGDSNPPGPPGPYADVLIPFLDPETGVDIEGAAFDAVPFGLDADRSQAIWADVAVPRDAPAGLYSGRCRVTWESGSAEMPISLRVWSFALPKRPALRTIFGVRQPVRSNLPEELLRHRLMPWPLEVSTAIDLDRRYGLNAIDTRIASGASIDLGKMRPAPKPETFTAIEQSYPPGLRPFLVNLTADEISRFEQLRPIVREWGRSMHSGSSVKNLITMVPTPSLFDDGTGRPAVDIWVVLPNQASDPATRALLDQARGLGCEVWVYTALNQDGYSPKWLINYSPLDFRIYAWINGSFGFNGVLYWRVDGWNGQGWSAAGYNGLPGEGFLVYPGEPAGLPGRVIPSLRLKYLRDGVDDYDYIDLLRRLGREKEAIKVVRRVAPDWRNWTRDPEALQAARQELGEMLDRLAPAQDAEGALKPGR